LRNYALCLRDIAKRLHLPPLFATHFLRIALPGVGEIGA